MTKPLHPVDTAALAAARAKPTLDEMAEFARAEASRISTTQRALMACGVRSEPDAKQIRKMVVADALVRFIESERGSPYA